MEWFLKVLRQYADFKGRARRKEYWMFSLFAGLFGLVFYVFLIAGILLNSSSLMAVGVGLYAIYGLGIMLPALAVSVRRLHDVGKSGWMLLVSIIPFVGSIWLLVLVCTDSQYGDNQWGPNPKDIGNQSEINEIGETVTY